MPKTAEKSLDPTLPLEGTVAEPAQAPSKSRAVGAHKPQPPARAPAEPVARSEAQAMLEMIAAAASNPKVNVDKLDRLLKMRDHIVAQARQQDYFDALALAQVEMEPVRADAENKETRSKYASHAALDRVLRPIYTKHGFSLSYDTEPHPLPEFMNFVCYATAKGHTRKHTIELPVDGKGPKGGAVMSRTHAASSGVTYAMRILLKMVFNIAVDRDDDGNAAGRIVNVDNRPKLTNEQIVQLINAMDAVGCSEAKFLKWVSRDAPQIKRLDDIPAELFDGCIQGLKDFKKSD